MAKTEAPAGKGGETLQIIILTLFMTGGGFALISAVLYLFLVPARASELEQQIRDSNALVELLDKNNQKSGMWKLRHQAREAEKTQGSKDLRDRVQEQLGDMVPEQFQAMGKKRVSNSNTWEFQQTIELKGTPVQQILDFVARVKGANPSVQVGNMRLTRTSRSSGPAAKGSADEDRWSGTVTFFLYTTSGPGGKAGPGAKAASKAEAEPPEDASGEPPPEPAAESK